MLYPLVTTSELRPENAPRLVSNGHVLHFFSSAGLVYKVSLGFSDWTNEVAIIDNRKSKVFAIPNCYKYKLELT